MPVFHGGALDKLSKGTAEGFYVVVADGICNFRDGQGSIYQQFTRFIDAHPLQVLLKGQPAGRLEFFADVGQAEKVFLADCGQRDMFIIVLGHVVADIGNILAFDVIHGGIEQQFLHGEGQDCDGTATDDIFASVGVGLERFQSAVEEGMQFFGVVMEHPVVGRGGQHGAIKTDSVALEQGIKRFDRIQVWLDQRRLKQEIDDDEII